jgi:hypothetical protein
VPTTKGGSDDKQREAPMDDERTNSLLIGVIGVILVAVIFLVLAVG